jgi:lipopolysaccharide export system protein LptA
MASVFENFNWVMRDEKSKQEEVRVTGSKVRLNPTTQLTDILLPIVVVTANLRGQQNGSGVDIELDKVHVTAKQGNMDESRGILRLSEDVRVKGKDFEVRTDDVTFGAADKELTSEAPVTLQGDKIKADGSSSPAMVVTGQGTKVNLLLRTMAINKQVTATLYAVSQDFLASESADYIGDVVITSDGRMLYEHTSRRVTFSNNVQVVAGAKTIRSDELVVQLGEAQDSASKVAVTNIVATGHVSLLYREQVARGDRLEWQEVTHTGILTGNPCSLGNAEIVVSGKQLSFYRFSSRFSVEGPGKLLWKGSPSGRPDASAAGRQRVSIGAVGLDRTEPVEVSWQKSMSYDVPGRMALFQENVMARQKNSSLQCQSLGLGFSADGRQIERADAQGNVVIREQSTAPGRQVTCDRLVWDARQDSVELRAEPGKEVSIADAGQAVYSSNITFDNARNSLSCPAPGRLTVAPRDAKGGPPARRADQVAVEWGKEMHLDQGSTPSATFAGNVTARRGNQLIRAENLRADFDQDWNPTAIVATGQAVIELSPPAPEQVQKRPGTAPAAPLLAGVLPGALPEARLGWKVASESLTVEPPRQAVRSSAPGTLTILKAEGPPDTVTWQRAMSIDQTDDMAVFEGQVHAVVSGSQLDAERLTVESNDAGEVRHITADGGVRFGVGQPQGWELTSAWAEAVFASGNALKQFIARDNVRVHDQNRLLTAGVLQLFLESVEGEKQPVIDRAVAQDNVHVEYQQTDKMDKMEGGGSRLEWDRKSDLYTLSGEPVAYLEQKNVRVENDRITWQRSGKTELPAGIRQPKVTVSVGAR